MADGILNLVYAAIDDVNALSKDGVRIQKDADAHLLGGEGGVDSLTFVNLIVAIEEKIQDSLGKTVVLINEDTMSLQTHPFRTVGTLVKYVEGVIG